MQQRAMHERALHRYDMYCGLRLRALPSVHSLPVHQALPERPKPNEKVLCRTGC